MLTNVFVRDRFTWLAYFMLAYYAYFMAILGPLMPFLRAELNLNYTLAGLHFSAFALGMVLAGVTGDRFARRWGRWPVFWGGGAGMAAGALCLVLGRQVAITVAGAFIMGWLGAFLLRFFPRVYDSYIQWKASCQWFLQPDKGDYLKNESKP